MSEQVIKTAHAYLAREHVLGPRHAFVADPHVQMTAGGRSVVRFQQHRGGIPLFGGEIALRIAEGRVIDMLGEVADLTTKDDGRPDLSAADAVMAAITHLRAKSDRSVCRVRHRSLSRATNPLVITLASFPMPSRPTVFRVGRTGTSSANLAYWRDGETTRLVWAIRAPVPRQSFLLLVAAGGSDAGRIIVCTRWSSSARCFGNVFSFDHGAGPRRLEFPFAADLPQFLPLPIATHSGPWVATDATTGNNAVTFDGNKTSLLHAATNANGDLEFPPFAQAGKEQTLLNAFFYCNLLHDFFLMLGFGENEGNFQSKNFSGAKGGNDRLEIRVFQQKNPHLADMDSLDDGKPAILSLGRAPNGEPSALHAELVTHEYTHGVVHRMVGGRLATAWLIQQQSQAMDEGWADYFAITLRNHYLHPATNYRFADWAGPGFRSAPYEPGVVRDYGKLGKPPQNTVNGAGEVFAAALIRFNEFLGERLGDAKRGHCIGWRAVIESLRLINANPNFLQGRDALRGGIDELQHGSVITAAEAADAGAALADAFAKYGMGKNAKSPDASFNGTIADTTV